VKGRERGESRVRAGSPRSGNGGAWALLLSSRELRPNPEPSAPTASPVRGPPPASSAGPGRSPVPAMLVRLFSLPPSLTQWRQAEEGQACQRPPNCGRRHQLRPPIGKDAPASRPVPPLGLGGWRKPSRPLPKAAIRTEMEEA